MAISNEAKLAKQELEGLNDQIGQAESNLRILRSIQAPNVLELQSNLNKAIGRRDQLIKAIDKEENGG